ncbi:MAG: hypothetical protein AAFR77_01465 [Cyanobacteria bacterium J06631_2]
MSNLFKYKIVHDSDSNELESYEKRSLYDIHYLASFLVAVTITSLFSAIVMILNYCFPGSLDGTYLKLFF